MVRRWIGLCVVVIATGVWAGDLKVPGSLTASFVQTAVGGGTISRSSGTLTLNRSRAFRLDVRRPTRQLICNYRSGVDLIDYAFHQVIRYDVGGLLDMMQILKVAEHYKGNVYKSRYHGYRFRLWTNKRGEVVKATFRGKNGIQNTVRFSNIRYRSKPFPAARFRCRAPRSYRVVHGKI
jgi:outer membrane lipoprotein-sorting protein